MSKSIKERSLDIAKRHKATARIAFKRDAHLRMVPNGNSTIPHDYWWKDDMDHLIMPCLPVEVQNRKQITAPMWQFWLPDAFNSDGVPVEQERLL